VASDLRADGARSEDGRQDVPGSLPARAPLVDPLRCRAGRKPLPDRRRPAEDRRPALAAARRGVSRERRDGIRRRSARLLRHGSGRLREFSRGRSSTRTTICISSSRHPSRSASETSWGKTSCPGSVSGEPCRYLDAPRRRRRSRAHGPVEESPEAAAAYDRAHALFLWTARTLRSSRR